ncbi:MAG: alanine--tRNA ligase, partial [Bacteroidales bacterium]|nr:alanine--tRNA ligase [Bacteroidales bacterium]
QDLVQRVISEEEPSFLRTLSLGIKRFEQYIHNHPDIKIIEGFFAFELFDTYGFPVDLTQLMAKERGWGVDMEGFTKRLEEQKKRSRQATAMDTGDWTVLLNEGSEPFLGYDTLETTIRISQYRKVKIKGKEWVQLVFDQTPFYAESGGQVGDKGTIERDGDKIPVKDTKKENNLVIHFVSKLPAHLNDPYKAVVDSQARMQTACNHSATHLLHNALREVLGSHVEQKGSFVGPDHLRFDFNHFQKVEKDELEKIEAIVNARIREDIVLDEKRSIPMKEALEMGAIAFFGEKYGEQVRVIRFGDSIELCGGTHVHATGQIGIFKITSEGAIASGIRRIEAFTAITAEKFITSQLNIIQQLKTELKSTNDLVKAVQSLLDQNNLMQKKIEQLTREKADTLTIELIQKIEKIGDIHFIGAIIDMDASALKELAFKMRQKTENLFLILGSSYGGKASLAVLISDSLLNEYKFHAGNIIREFAQEIQGGGGGQPYFATAGGKNPDGIGKAIEKAREYVVNSV